MTTELALVPPKTTAIVETAASAMASTARALIEARYTVALRFPRDIDSVRAKLLNECRRPGFADAAIYRKPIGKDPTKWPTGPSIRFAESAMRIMGNLEQSASIRFDDDTRRIVEITVTDLETNSTASGSVVVVKSVERRFLPHGETPIGVRTNSNGDTLYIIRASDDDVLMKQNSQISKLIRTLVIRMVPADIVEECMDLARKTQNAQDAVSPDESRRRMFDKFESIGVSVVQIKAYLGHDAKVLSAKETSDMRAIYTTIKEGETTWKDIEDLSTKEKKASTDLEKAGAMPDPALTKPAAQPTIPAPPATEKAQK